MIEKIREVQDLSTDQIHCKDGKVIEDFGHAQNLMLLNIPLFQNIQEALESLTVKSV